VVADLAARLPGTPRVVTLGPTVDGLETTAWAAWLPADAAPLVPVRLPFDHPLAVLYSSGTTGLPKAIVHRAGGTLLEHHKELRLHGDIGPGDRVVYFTTCGWMMWNWLVSALAEGATIVLFDGSPSYRRSTCSGPRRSFGPDALRHQRPLHPRLPRGRTDAARDPSARHDAHGSSRPGRRSRGPASSGSIATSRPTCTSRASPAAPTSSAAS
jgi:hypothetical protein